MTIARGFVERVVDLPSPSSSVMRLMDLLGEPEPDYGEIVHVVHRDGPLCAQVLAVCNSAYLGLSAPVGSLDQAVFHVGYEELYRVVLGISFGGTFSHELRGYGLKGNELWSHSLLVAVAAQWVGEKAERTPAVETSIVYTAGLVHDIGKLVLGQLVEDRLQDAVRDLMENRGMSGLCAERSVLGTDHAEVGASLLESWGFPTAIVQAVRSHHAPVCHPAPTISAIVHVANFLAQSVMGPKWPSLEEVALEALGLTEGQVEEMLLRARESLDEIQKWVTVGL